MDSLSRTINFNSLRSNRPTAKYQVKSFYNPIKTSATSITQ